jgi:hypothetical protein
MRAQQKQEGKHMMIVNILEHLAAAFRVRAVEETKRLHITLFGLRFTVQYGDNRALYAQLTREELLERFIWADYRLAVLEEVDLDGQSPLDRAELLDEMEELEEQFQELAGRIEYLDSMALTFAPKQLCMCG